MAQTIIQKLLANGAHVDAVDVGSFVTVDVDMTVLLDLQFRYDRLSDLLRVQDPDKLAIVMDHAVPAPSVQDAQNGQTARLFAKQHRIERFFDIGHHGIVHQVIAEQRLAKPGQILACTDSHTCAAGAYNVAARGLGPAEIMQIVATGKTWHVVPQTIRYELHGELQPGVYGKDLFLFIAGKWGDATGCALEFGGPGLASISMVERRTVATQGAEIGADFVLFPPDDLCMAHFAGHGQTPSGFWPDDRASYLDTRTIFLNEIRPMVGLPGGVINNTAEAASIGVRTIDQAFIGSCANGRLEDLRIAAEILRDKSVAPGVRLIVTPASQQIYIEATRAGYVETIASAGGVVTNSTCGACFGYHMGVVGPGEVCITASTRNFRGRMGSIDAEIYMASPATVAASALTGRISVSDPVVNS